MPSPRQAGISKGGLLYHYPSKKKLIEAMVMRLIAEVDQRLAQELANSGGNYVTALRAGFIWSERRIDTHFVCIDRRRDQ